MFDVGNDFGNFVLGNHVQGLREAIPKKSESWDMEGGGGGSHRMDCMCKPTYWSGLPEERRRKKYVSNMFQYIKIKNMFKYINKQHRDP